jgi:hypothetical protein
LQRPLTVGGGHDARAVELEVALVELSRIFDVVHDEHGEVLPLGPRSRVGLRRRGFLVVRSARRQPPLWI